MSHLAPESEIDAILWLKLHSYEVDILHHEIKKPITVSEQFEDRLMIEYLVKQNGYMEVKA